MEQLDGRGAVVIGGGSGVGRGIALGLAAEGMRVMVADIDGAAAAAVRAELDVLSAHALDAAVDATDDESLGALAGRAAAELGAVHVLVSTVGAIVDRPLAEASERDWAWLFELNVMSQVRGVRAFLPLLRAHGGPAHIVNTSSMAGLLALGPAAVGGVHNGLYTATKHALVGYSEMLRMELEPEGIGVSVLCPGLVQGNLGATSARHRPARHGGPFEDPRAGRGMPATSMPNERVGPIVARGIKGNRFYIFTHPEAVALVEARHAGLLADAVFFAEGP